MSCRSIRIVALAATLAATIAATLFICEMLQDKMVDYDVTY